MGIQKEFSQIGIICEKFALSAEGMEKGRTMPPKTIYKTVHQYSKFPVPAEDMKKLLEIAEDYRRVKNYVYARYGGIGGLGKLHPGYTVQNEMTESGLRTELGLPSVYFYLAVFEALVDVKGQWSRTKSKLQELVGRNENFTAEEKHYLRFVLKTGNALDAVLNRREPELPEKLRVRYEGLAGAVDAARLNRYLGRQVRKYHDRSYAGSAAGFSVSERAYRYGFSGKQPGIYLSTKENRKRIFVALTDGNQYGSQLFVRLKPEEAAVEIDVPVNVTVRSHEDYTNQVGLAMGVFTMLTTDAGRRYGERFGVYQTEYAEWVRERQASYHRNREANPGRKKYEAQKRRRKERLHSYVNQELNRFFREEKPRAVYLVKLPSGRPGGVNRKINNGLSLWQRGYIRERLWLKCRERSVEFAEVLGKDISRECSRCGALGRKEHGSFVCAACGYCGEEKTNTARNVLKRGLSGRTVG